MIYYIIIIIIRAQPLFLGEQFTDLMPVVHIEWGKKRPSERLLCGSTEAKSFQQKAVVRLVRWVDQLAQSQSNVRNVNPIPEADSHTCVHHHPQQNSCC